MKKLFVLLFLPIGILAQTTELNNTVEKSKDSTEKPQEVKDAKSDAVEAKLLSPVCSSGDCLDGVGTMNYKSGTYIGHWKEGLRHGEGKYVWNNGDMYNGNWDLDKRHGQGIYVWHDGSKYIGNYSCGVRSGYGLYYYTNGTIYEGTWQNNLKHGIANFYYKESVNLGGKYFNNEYVGGTGVTQGTYKYKPE
jgi:hypothetical protein